MSWCGVWRNTTISGLGLVFFRFRDTWYFTGWLQPLAPPPTCRTSLCMYDHRIQVTQIYPKALGSSGRRECHISYSQWFCPWGDESKVLWLKSIPVLLFPPQNPYGLVWDRSCRSQWEAGDYLLKTWHRLSWSQKCKIRCGNWWNNITVFRSIILIFIPFSSYIL